MSVGKFERLRKLRQTRLRRTARPTAFGVWNLCAKRGLSSVSQRPTRQSASSLVDTSISWQYIFYTCIEFEFDPSKSKKNLDKHGIDFVQVQSLWKDEDRLEIPARTEDEPRSVLIAMLGQKLWSAFFTYRSGRIRLISVRRARQEERKLYDEGEES